MQIKRPVRLRNRQKKRQRAMNKRRVTIPTIFGKVTLQQLSFAKILQKSLSLTWYFVISPFQDVLRRSNWQDGNRSASAIRNEYRRLSDVLKCSCWVIKKKGASASLRIHQKNHRFCYEKTLYFNMKICVLLIYLVNNVFSKKVLLNL